MSTIQKSEVKTLSDRAEIRSAHRADQAIHGRPVDSAGRADIDSTAGSVRPAVAGAHGTAPFLFDGMQTADTRGARGHSASKGRGRMGAHNDSVVRDRHSSQGQAGAGKGIHQIGGPSTERGATPSVMTAELPFATSAVQENAGERKLRRQPDAGPYRGMRMPRRSSLPTHNLTDAQPAIALGGMPRSARISTGTGALEWRDAFDAAKPAFPVDVPVEPETPFQRLSQLLAKPEVGGYLVMGALIACTFLI